jgi:hypothetical protein
MALGDIIVLQENAGGTYDEIALEVSTVTSIAAQTLTATASQTVFNFTDPVAGRTIFVNGMHYANTINYTVTDTNQITLTDAAQEYDIITAEAKN